MRGSAKMPKDMIETGHSRFGIKESFRVETFWRHSAMSFLVKLSPTFHTFGTYMQSMIPQM